MARNKKFALSVVIDAVDRITAPLQRVQKRVRGLFAPFRRLSQSIRQLGRAAGVQKLGRALRRAGGAAKRLAGSLGRVGGRLGAMATLAGAGVARMVHNFATGTDEAVKFSRSVGISVQAYKEWSFLAERAGVKQDVFNSSLTAFTKRVGELRQDTGSMNTLLNKLGGGLKERILEANSTEEAFAVLMKGMAGMTKATDKAALASAAFSRQGVPLTNIAKLGASEIDGLRAKFRELHGELSGDVLKASEKYTDELTNLQTAFSGVQFVIGAKLMPVITRLFKRLTGWLVENRAAIGAWMKEFLDKLPGRLKRLKQGFDEMMASAEPMTGALRWLGETFGWLNIGLAALAGIIFGPVITALVALAPSIYAVGYALLTTPIGWFLGAMAALAAAATWVVSNWEHIAGFFGWLWGSTKETFVEFGKWAWKWVRTLFPGIAIIQDNWGAITEWFSDLWQGVKDTFSGFWDWVKSWGDSIGKVVDAILAPLMAPIRAMRTLLGFLPDSIKQTLGIETSGASGKSTGAAAAQQGIRDERVERKEGRVELDFKNLPQGVQAKIEGEAQDAVDVNMGMAMQGA